jgi:hypothetical protein
VVYIGTGAGKGTLRYVGHGLGSRLQNYCFRDFTVKATDLASESTKFDWRPFVTLQGRDNAHLGWRDIAISDGWRSGKGRQSFRRSQRPLKNAGAVGGFKRASAAHLHPGSPPRR